MTPEEAIKDLLHDRANYDSYYAIDAEKEHMSAIDIAVKALEKQIPKKPLWEHADFVCPNCRTTICYTHYDDDYCYACGQRIDWGDEE